MAGDTVQLTGSPQRSQSAARKLDLPVVLPDAVTSVPAATPTGTPVFRKGAPTFFPLANQLATLAAPASGQSRIFTHNVGGRPMLKVEDEFGHDYALQEDMARNKVCLWTPINGSATGSVFGLPAWTSQGTPTARTAAITNAFTAITRQAWVSATSGAGSIAEGRINQAIYTAGTGSALGYRGFKVTFRFAITDGLTGGKFFAGMAPAAAATNVESNTLTNSIGIGVLSTDNTQFYICYGGTTAQTAIPVGTGLGAPTSTTTMWELVITSPPSATNLFYLQFTNLMTGATFSTYTTAPLVASPAAATVPINSVGLAPKIYRVTPSTTAGVFELSNLQISTDT